MNQTGTDGTFPEWLSSFTERELEVLRLVSDGLTNQQIAERLVITVGTVRWYTKQIFSKLNVHNRTHAVAQARALGLLSSTLQPQTSPLYGEFPAQLTSFIGRDEELAQIGQYLADRSCRLLTLTGPGGVGKTRLAIEAVRLGKSQQEKAIHFVNLVGIQAGGQVQQAILDSIGVSPQPLSESWQLLLDYLRDRQLLLLIDNFEHVLSEAMLLSRLLEAAPHLEIIVTSREVLRLEEEWVYVVEGMDIPNPGAERSATSFGAVQLFIERALRIRSDLALEQELSCISEICRLVQGIPLAIELAASRLRQQSCEEIALGLTRNNDFLTTAFRNVPERHRSMRAVFTWSWGLLSETEQLAFMKLSVFRGGCTREAAEFVSASPLSTLFALVDKSLLRLHPNRRYTIHEILRQYSYEKLLDHKLVKQAKDAHLDYYTAFVEHLTKAMAIQDPARRSRLEQDYDNIRAAFEWCQQGEGSSETGLRLAIAMFDFWRIGSYLGEGLKYLKGFLNKLPVSQSPSLRAKASARAAWLAVVFGDLAQAEALSRACLTDDYQSDLWTKALALNVLGTVMRSRADYTVAKHLYDSALATSETVGDMWLIAVSVGNHAVLAFHQGDKPEAIRRFEQVLPLYHALNDHFYVALITNLLGRSMRQSGQYRRALELCQSELQMAITGQDKWAIAVCLSGLAGLCTVVAWYEGAARLLAIEAGLRASLHASLSPSIIPDHEAVIAVVRNHLDTASWNVLWASGYTLPLEQVIPIAVDYLNLVAAKLDENSQKTPPEMVQMAEPLTPRELEILRLMAAGLSNQEIAARYVVALGTIAAHSHRIFVKLEVRNRMLAVTKSRAMRLL